jgi:hypothetical protein
MMSGGRHRCGGECHGYGRIVAHFRRTRYLPPRHRKDGNGVSRMNDISAELAVKTAHQRGSRQAAAENIALQLCYGQIGISAVAAAVRYQGDAKNPAYAPAVLKWDERALTAA